MGDDKAIKLSVKYSKFDVNLHQLLQFDNNRTISVIRLKIVNEDLHKLSFISLSFLTHLLCF